MPKKPKHEKEAKPALKEPKTSFGLFNLEAIALFGTAILFYCTSIFSGYALDDTVVIRLDDFVKKGFGGFYDILSKDTFYNIGGSTGILAGGRYRPLSVLTFATEWEFFGEAPHISHLINVVLYAVSGVVLYKFLKAAIFKTNNVAAFIAAFLFIIHPVHTEVVDNIKSRDEILGLLGAFGSCYLLFEFLKKKKLWLYLLSCLCFFLALFSKENVFTWVIIIPLLLFLFSAEKNGSIFRLALPYLIVAMVFLLIRFSVVGIHSQPQKVEFLNDPYLYAGSEQRYATIILTLLYYLKLLVAPYPLSYDYSYNQIPLTGFTDYRVIFSVIVHLALLFFAIWSFKKYKVLSFAILYYFITFSLTNNLLFNVGAPMGERFLYMPSIGFCIAVSFLAWKGFEFMKKKSNAQMVKYSQWALMGALTLLAGIVTYGRNRDWKNEINLFIHDAESVPNSAPAQLRCGIAYKEMADTSALPEKKFYYDESITHLQKAISIYPVYLYAWVNLAEANMNILKTSDAETALIKAMSIDSTNAHLKALLIRMGKVFLDSAIATGGRKHLDSAFYYIKKAEKYVPGTADLYYNYGGYYFTAKDYTKARDYWNKCLSLNPNYTAAKEGIEALPE